MFSVLYIDDEPALLDLGRTFLEMSGFLRIDTALSTLEAIEKLKTTSFDCIVSDYQIPGMNGIEFLKYIRAMHPELPFILFTGRGREEVVIEAIDYDVDSYVQKGGESTAQFAELSHRIRNAIDRRKAVRALRESEDRYRAVVETQTELISRFLPDGTHIFVNEAYCRYFSKTAQEILGTKFHPSISPEDKRAIRDHLGALTVEHPEATMEHALQMQHGEVRWQQWSDRAIFGESGQVREYQSVGRDITDRIHKEEELKKGRNLLYEAMDLARMADWEFDIGKRMFTFNERFYYILGTTARQEGGILMPAEVYIREFIHPDDRTVFSTIEEVFLKESGPVIILQREHRVVRRDGKIRHIIARLRFYKGPGKDSYRCHGSIQDITDIRLVTDALRESEEAYRTVFENTGTAMVLINEDTTISLANAEFEHLSGYTKSELEGKMKWTDTVVKEDLDRMLAQHRRRRENNESSLKHYTFHFLTRSGEIRNIVLTIDIIPGTKRSVASLVDITDQRRVEDAFINANKKLKILSSITRHDVCNQIFALKSCLELSKGSLGDAARIREYIGMEEQAVTAIERQFIFTRDYEDLGGDAPIWQDLYVCLQKSLAILPMRDIQVSATVTGIKVYADPLFEKVFYNLFDNALRYGGDQMTTIRVSHQESRIGLTIICEDNGIGISPGDKQHLFTKGFGKNTGFGLFLSREILSITGITIAENSSPGNGARFEITVPKEGYRFTETRK